MPFLANLTFAFVITKGCVSYIFSVRSKIPWLPGRYPWQTALLLGAAKLSLHAVFMQTRVADVSASTGHQANVCLSCWHPEALLSAAAAAAADLHSLGPNLGARSCHLISSKLPGMQEAHAKLLLGGLMLPVAPSRPSGQAKSAPAQELAV